MDLRTSISFDPEILEELEVLAREEARRTLHWRDGRLWTVLAAGALWARTQVLRSSAARGSHDCISG